MEKTEINKKKRKKVILLLIVILLALTFFSRSFYNYRLPVVTVTLPRQGKLAYTVEGSAEFSYSNINTIYADMDGRIKEILVKEGEEVRPGQCLMKVALNATEETYDVNADKSGIIVSIGIEKGMYVSSMQNTVLFYIADISDEWVCSMIISDEQSEDIDMESTVELHIGDRKESIEGKIQSINGYVGQNQVGYQVNIVVHSEESLLGEHVNITLKKESSAYDTLIPAAALRKDATGYYVLVLRTDDSVLGNGYKAHRMSVDLLDSDESYCAVRGLPTDEQVIISSVSEIMDGSDVFYEGDEV